MTKFKVL